MFDVFLNLNLNFPKTYLFYIYFPQTCLRNIFLPFICESSHLFHPHVMVIKEIYMFLIPISDLIEVNKYRINNPHTCLIVIKKDICSSHPSPTCLRNIYMYIYFPQTCLMYFYFYFIFPQTCLRNIYIHFKLILQKHPSINLRDLLKQYFLSFISE